MIGELDWRERLWVGLLLYVLCERGWLGKGFSAHTKGRGGYWHVKQHKPLGYVDGRWGKKGKEERGTVRWDYKLVGLASSCLS